MLHDGIYEQLISKGLERELEKSDKYRLTEPIDTAEASKVLAKYVASVVERGMEIGRASCRERVFYSV